eukprot:4295380-Pleurochrysis_carterae.AAC.1
MLEDPGGGGQLARSVAFSDSASAVVGHPRQGCCMVECAKAKRELKPELEACQKELRELKLQTASTAAMRTCVAPSPS